jgi:hypothetical protein
MGDAKESGGRWWEGEGAAGFNFTEDNEGDNTDDYTSEGCDFVNRSVLRKFGRGIESYGTVVSWLPAHLNEGEPYYRVRHDDGDEEDLDEAELAEALKAAEEQPRPVTAVVKTVSNEKALEALDDHGKPPEAPLSYETPPDAQTKRLASAWKGLSFIADLLDNDLCAKNFGADALTFLSSVAATAPDPLRALATFHVERLAIKWRDGFAFDSDQAEPPECADALCGIAALERCGVGHANLKLECRDYVAKTSKARGADVFASSFLGANLSRPAQGTKDVTDAQRRMTRIKAATQALYHASYADRAGVHITHDESSVLKWIDGLKPYMPFAQLGWEGYVDQATLACAIIDISSNYGELRLRPSAFPDEYSLLADVACMTRAIRKEDVHLAGAVVRALRSFGLEDDDGRVKRGCEYIMQAQTTEGDDSGGWPTRDKDTSSYAYFHAAACAVGALYAPLFRGFGPACGSPASDGFSACGAQLRSEKAMGFLAEQYAAGAAAGDEAWVSALKPGERACRRLAGLLKWHAAMQKRSIDDYDEGAPVRRRTRLR